ncbi:MAG: type II toxin-antitoxin system Phd/YefM family antitoxin [Mycobacteriales bacterium]
MTAITASQARKTLFPLIQEVNTDHVPVEIVSKHGNAVLVSKADWDSMEETAYLLRSPANAARLAKAMAQANRGEAAPHELYRS